METNFKLKSGSVSDRGLSEKRPQNEDSYVDMPQLGLFAVADGVGGANAGEVASQMAVEIISEAFASLRPGDDAEQRMRAAITQANSAIHQMSSDIPQLSTMATTIVALHISDNIATIGHVGDSRLYRVDEKGNLYRETRDHSVVEEEVRAGRLSPDQAAVHPQRNVISRALGAEAGVEVDLKTLMFSAGTSFLLCSDGITRHITDLEISQLLMSPLEADEVCHTMKSLCYERGAEDNLTAVVVRCGQRAVAAPTVEEEDLLEIEEPASSAIRTVGGIEVDLSPIMEQDTEPAAPVQVEPAPSKEPDTGLIGFESLSGQLSYSVEEQDQQLASIGVDPEWSAKSEVKPETPAEPPQTGQRHRTRNVDDLDLLVYQGSGSGSGSGGGSMLAYIGMLIVGAILGVGGAIGYQMMAPPPPAPVDDAIKLQTPAPQIPAEDSARRSIDANPQAGIDNLKTLAVKTAEDNYLLARAYARLNKPEEAKIALENAVKQLADVAEEDRTSLATDIAILQAALLEAGGVQKRFSSLADAGKPREPGPNTNANANAANASGNAAAKANSNTKPAANTKPSNAAGSNKPKT